MRIMYLRYRACLEPLPAVNVVVHLSPWMHHELLKYHRDASRVKPAPLPEYVLCIFKARPQFLSSIAPFMSRCFKIKPDRK